MNLIIGLSGKRGVGKTTAADTLVKDVRFIKRSLATKLKEISSKIFPFGYDEIYGKDKESKFSSYEWTSREFMIKLGEFIRYWDKDYFINEVINGVSTYKDSRIVIDDVRFINEAETVRKLGGVIIRINRYSNLNIYKTVIDHSSETELDNYKFDFTINEHQNVSLEDLRTNIRRCVSQLI